MGPHKCVFCGEDIDGGDAAIGVGVGSEDPVYVPFLEELTQEYAFLMHSACFGREHSVDSLVDVIHEHDRRQRDAFRALRGGR